MLKPFEHVKCFNIAATLADFMVDVLCSLSDVSEFFNDGQVTVMDLRPLILQLLTNIL